MIHRRLARIRCFAIAALCLLTACSRASDTGPRNTLDRFSLNAESVSQWKLPKKLTEISGLALTPDNRLLAICDERAIVYELDYEEGRIVKAFALGKPTERGDFEGIAYLDEIIYLVTSNGRIYATSEGADGERMSFEVYKTGLGKLCEIEGLTEDVQSKTLLLACKEKRKKGGAKELSIFSWSPTQPSDAEQNSIALPESEIEDRLGKKHVNPSGVAFDPITGSLFVIAARQRAIIELKPNGDLINAIILPLSDRHRQPEGIALTRDGKLLIADEGAGKRAVLSVYKENK